MKYDNENVRRRDRLMDEATATELLTNSEYGVLSLTDEDGKAYGIPVNYVWDGNDSIYIHCAPEGKKLRGIEKKTDVSLCVVGHTHLIPNKFTTEYESIVMQGTARIHLDDEEKMRALRLIIRKFSPNDAVIGEKYAKGSFHRVEIIRIDVSLWSGKCKHVHSAD
jgi:nitroimidazol reductase NimA-like FMN-containing flavoprotein (pyridoxamine 5'-phosphate oxidase superfamily)